MLTWPDLTWPDLTWPDLTRVDLTWPANQSTALQSVGNLLEEMRVALMLTLMLMMMAIKNYLNCTKNLSYASGYKKIFSETYNRNENRKLLNLTFDVSLIKSYWQQYNILAGWFQVLNIYEIKYKLQISTRAKVCLKDQWVGLF